MSTPNARERRDWRLPAKEPLPCLKKLSPDKNIEEDFVIVEEVKDIDLTESKISDEKKPEATVEKPKDGGDTAAESHSSFVDMMLPVAAQTKTENNANAYSTTLNAPLDFFASVVPGTETEEVFRLLDAAWAENPSVTLRCIFHLRDVRNGKSDAFKFSDSLYWLYQKHPQTLIANLRHIPRTGYWKDLLNFLVRVVVGEDLYQEEVEKIKLCDRTKKSKKLAQEQRILKWKIVLEEAKEKWTEKPADKSSFRKRPVFALLYKKELALNPDVNPLTHAPWSARSQKRRRWIHRTMQNIKNGVPQRNLEEVREDQIARGQQNKLEAALLRHTKRSEQTVKACDVFETDSVYRAVHIEIARLFAQALSRDLAKMQKCASSPKDAKKRENFCSLASKWAPSLDRYHDKITHIATTITQILFQDESDSTQISAVGISRMRDRYRKEIITPLRKHIKVVESMLGYSLCHEIDYKTVPAVSMRRNRPLFEKLDAERFEGYLKDVKEGKTTIAASALKPHELVREIMRELGHGSEEDGSSEELDEEDEEDETKAKRDCEDQVRELQWASYRDRLTKTGKLDHVMAIVDVSGSMEGEPMEVAIALGILCAEVSKPPYNKLLCTFSEKPQLFLVNQPSLREKVKAVSKMKWGMNTNFEAVFDLILERALASKLPPEDMISLLIVFSDMEFDEASSHDSEEWTSLHDHINNKFQKHGYTMPAIVYWNLSGGKYLGRRTGCAFPVTEKQKGVAMVSGFSGQMLKLFMDGDLNFDPILLMNKALNRYHFLTVVD